MENISLKNCPCEVQFKSCKYGNSCQFKNMHKNTCITFLTNKCKYDKECKYFHDDN